jgi:predicted transcriptional regulator
MNIMLFLTHKSDITYLFDDYTIEEGLNILRETSYTAVPLISRDGTYIGTVTEGDFLWALTDAKIWESRNTLRMDSVQRHVMNKPVRADAQITDLLNTAMNQNFVPVIDDRNCFVGIVTRKRILDYCVSEMEKIPSQSTLQKQHRRAETVFAVEA